MKRCGNVDGYASKVWNAEVSLDTPCPVIDLIRGVGALVTRERRIFWLWDLLRGSCSIFLQVCA
jgi:hypothetical protein